MTREQRIFEKITSLDNWEERDRHRELLDMVIVDMINVAVERLEKWTY